jgi:hypothetical protein
MRHTIYTTVFLNGYGYIFFTIVKTNTTFKSEWEHTDKKSSLCVCVWEREREREKRLRNFYENPATIHKLKWK